MKPKSKVYEQFLSKNFNEKTAYECKYCKHIYLFKNATKFKIHLQKCVTCPFDIKNMFKNKKNTTQPQEERPGTSSDNCLNENRNKELDTMDIHRHLSRAIYVTGTPLSIFEHPLWQQTLHKLNSTYSPPSRKVLATSLLDAEYTEMQNNILEKLKQASVLHLGIDGWSNLRNEPILNVLLYGPKPYFYKFIATKNIRHTAEYLSEEITKVMEELGATKFLAIITDNASNMVKSGRLIKEKYNQTIWIGCLAHTLHLLIGDMLKINKIRDQFSYIVDIIKCTTKSHIVNAEFRRIAEDKVLNVSLQLPVKTRWGSYLHCLDSFLKSKIVLQNLVINNENLPLAKYKVKLLDEAEWLKIEELKTLLKPIVDWIIKLEGDYCSIHLVHKALRNIGDMLNNLDSRAFLGSDQMGLITKFNNRKANALKPIHFAAAILDPNNQGAQLNNEENIDGIEVIMNLNESNSGALMEELTNYKCHRGIWEKDFVWKMAETTEPLLWWETLFEKSFLGQVAIKILSVPATSASVERSFSTFANIHTQKRNKLTTNRAGKICFIAHNWKLMNGHQDEKSSTEKKSVPDMRISSSTESDSDVDFWNEPSGIDSVNSTDRDLLVSVVSTSRQNSIVLSDTDCSE